MVTERDVKRAEVVIVDRMTIDDPIAINTSALSISDSVTITSAPTNTKKLDFSKVLVTRLILAESFLRAISIGPAR